MEFQNGILTQETSIGKISINISQRQLVSYTLTEDDFGYLYRGIIFPCEIIKDGILTKGWTFSAYINFDISSVYTVLIDKRSYIVWNDDGIRII